MKFLYKSHILAIFIIYIIGDDFIKKKLLVSLFLFVFVIMLYIIPSNYDFVNYKEELVYVSDEGYLHDIFLVDSNNYVSLTKVNIESGSALMQAKDILNILVKDHSLLPNGFISYIPDSTKIHNVMLEGDLLKIDFTNDLFNVKEEYEEKVIESLIYSLTSIDGVNKIMIFIDGEVLSHLPISNKSIPTILDRSYGINKKYDFSSLKDISSYTVYYINKHNDDYYYVPVTNYVNDNREKISIIIDELSSNTSGDNLMSFLSDDLELLSSFIYDSSMTLDFNDALYTDNVSRNILEEVVYSISLSVFDNYKGIKEVVFTIDNEEILKKRVEY